MSAARASAAACLAALLAVAPAAGAQDGAPTSAPAAPPALVRSGDVLRVAVWRNPELSGDLPVGDDGTLQHPLYRNVRVAGLPRPEVVTRVREALQRFEVDPQFVVEPLYRVSVVGEVRSPNLYAVQPGVTVAQAVAMAGGRTDRARPRATLARDGRRLPVDLERPHGGNAALRVQSADQIEVGAARTSATTVVSLASAVLAGVTSVLLIARSR